MVVVAAPLCPPRYATRFPARIVVHVKASYTVCVIILTEGLRRRVENNGEDIMDTKIKLWKSWVLYISRCSYGSLHQSLTCSVYIQLIVSYSINTTQRSNCFVSLKLIILCTEKWYLDLPPNPIIKRPSPIIIHLYDIW